MITATVRNYIQFNDDLDADLVYSSGELDNSPAIQEVVSLAIGDNVFLVPAVTGFTVHGLVIVPPIDNTVEPILKGVTGDTGISLSADKVSVFQFGTVPAQILLVASAAAAGFRLIWF